MKGNLLVFRSNNPRSLQAAVLLSLLLFVLSAVTAIGQLLWSQRIRLNGGCGWDGYYYCAMLNGATVPEPYSRRILLPRLAEHVATDSLTGFWLVNVLGLVGAVVIAMYITWRLTAVNPTQGQLPFAYRAIPSLLAGATFLAARNSFHIVATYPALSDPLALFLFLSGVALVILPSLSLTTRLLLIPVCFLAPLAREQLAAVLALSLVLAGLMRLLPWLLSIACITASLVGGAFAFHQPHSGSAQSVGETIRFWIEQDFGSWNGFFRFNVMVLLALGPFVVALGARQARPSTNRAALWIVSVAFIFAASSLFGGGDTDRILAPAGLLAAIAVMITGCRSGKGALGLSLIVAAYFVQQEPFHGVSGDPTAWLTFFGLRVTALRSVVENALLPTLIALPLGVAGFMLLQSREIAEGS